MKIIDSIRIAKFSDLFNTTAHHYITSQSHQRGEVAGVTFSDFDSAPVPKFLKPDPLSREISDLCEIYGLLLFLVIVLLRVKE